jgi:hypothetical protein
VTRVEQWKRFKAAKTDVLTWNQEHWNKQAKRIPLDNQMTND